MMPSSSRKSLTDCRHLARAEVRKAVGVDPGAVCPITLNMGLLVDSKVMETEKINFGSGNHMYGLEIRTRDLKKVVAFRVVDVAKAA